MTRSRRGFRHGNEPSTSASSCSRSQSSMTRPRRGFRHGYTPTTPRNRDLGLFRQANMSSRLARMESSKHTSSRHETRLPLIHNSIIFVHGLGSNPDTTCSARKQIATSDRAVESAPDSEQYVTWISDFLPEALPAAIRKDTRIFFYNYDSYWKRDAVHTRLWNLGNGLLEHINAGIRQSEEVWI
jgi:hypothetical protein